MTNRDFGISDNSWKIIIHTLSLFKEVERASIFGSRSKGNYKKGSDIDIVIYGPEVNEELALNISAKLNEELPTPYFYDVLSYSSIESDELIEHIDKVGKMFYKKE